MKNTYESICMYRLYTKRRWMCNILWKSGCVKYEKGMKCLQKITSVDSSPICLIIRLLAKQIGTNCLAIYVINRKKESVNSRAVLQWKHIVFFSYIINSVNILTKRKSYLCQLETACFWPLDWQEKNEYHTNFTRWESNCFCKKKSSILTFKCLHH